MQLRLSVRALSRTLFLNGGNPADEIAALVLGVVVAAVVWLIMRNRPDDEEEEEGEDGENPRKE